MSQSSSPPSILHVAEKPGDHGPCQYIHVLPVRYAMSSEPAPPVEQKFNDFVKNHCRAGTQMCSHYTLRLLRVGSFVHVYIPGYPATRHVWEVGETGKLKKIGTPAAPDTLLGRGSGNNPAFTYMLELPRLETAVWMAVTDIEWDEEVWQRVEETPGLRMQAVVPATGESPALSLVFPTLDVRELVEEFRRRPGYLQALHEFEYFKSTFDPDVSHLEPADADEDYIPDVVNRRWRWSSEKFLWKHDSTSQAKEAKPEALLFEEALQAATCPHYGVALADPVGLALDGAGLNHAAVRASGDLAAWFGDAVALAHIYNAYDKNAHFLSTQPNEWRGYTKKDTDSAMLAHSFGETWKQISLGMGAQHVFWGETLNGTGPWSFHQVMMQDFLLDVPHPVRGDAAQKLFARCVRGLTAMENQSERVYEAFTRGLLHSLAELAATIIRAAIPDKQKIVRKYEDDPRTSLDIVCSAFSGLFHLYEPTGGLHPTTLIILDALIDALTPYYTPVTGEKAAKDPHLLTLEEMQLLSEDDRIRYNGSDGVLHFSPFNTCWNLWEPDPGLTGSDILKKADTPGLADLASVEALKPLEKKYGLVTPGVHPGWQVVDLNVQAISAVKASLVILKGTLAGITAWNAILKIKDTDMPVEQALNALSAFSSVIVVAQQGVNLIETGFVYAFNMKQSVIKGSQPREVKVQAKVDRGNIEKQYKKLFMDNKLKSHWAKVLKWAGVAGDVALLGDAFWKMTHDQTEVAMGEFLLFFGTKVFRIQPELGIIMIAAGVAVIIICGPTRVQYRLRRGYFGKNCHLLTGQKTEKQEFAWLLTRMSYKKGLVPEDNIVNLPPAEMWTVRHANCRKDVAMGILLELKLFAEVRSSHDGQNLEVDIMVGHAEPESWIQILKVTSKDNGLYDDITALFPPMSWKSGFRNNLPCWSCTVPRKAVRADHVSMPLGQGTYLDFSVYRLSFDIAFHYTDDEALVGPDNLLRIEDILYKDEKPVLRRDQKVRIAVDLEMRSGNESWALGFGTPL